MCFGLRLCPCLVKPQLSLYVLPRRRLSLLACLAIRASGNRHTAFSSYIVSHQLGLYGVYNPLFVILSFNLKKDVAT